MPQFRYRAVTHAGVLVVGEVDASSREEVVRRIEYLGHLTIDAEIAATGILDRGRRSIGKLPRSHDLSIFLGQLALLIDAGLTLDAALQTLGDDASKGLSGFAGGLRASISLTLEIAAMLRRERLGAVMTGRERQVSVDGEQRVLIGDGGDVVAVPRDVVLDILGIDALWSGRQAVVRFHPDGASTGAVLKLSREKVEYEIRVNWYTGGVAIAP